MSPRREPLLYVYRWHRPPPAHKSAEQGHCRPRLPVRKLAGRWFVLRCRHPPRIHCHAMSDLTAFERLKLERLFRMESGYVLNFSNRTFFAFVLEATGRDIDEFQYGGGSKANRLRAFWRI